MKVGLRELLFVAVILGLLVSSYVFIFRPNDQKRARLQADIQTWQKAIADLSQSTSGVDDIGHRIGDLQQAISFFESRLPQEREIDKVLKEVWQMAEANSLVTRTIKPLKNERAAGYCEQPIQMSLTGDFNGFYAFLLQLEKLPRITRINQMALSKVPEHNGEMKAQLTMSIFFEPANNGQMTVVKTSN